MLRPDKANGKSELQSVLQSSFLSIEKNSIKLGGPAHGIVTRTVHKTLPGGGRGPGGGGSLMSDLK